MKKFIVQPRPVSSPLLKYRGKVNSQFGEDGILAHVMNRIRPRVRYCIEFGAWDGKSLSNCFNLIVNNGWHGLMIEANPARFQDLLLTYAGRSNVTPVNRMVTLEGEGRLDHILHEHGAPKDPALLSIDIDGNDYHVWESLTDFTPEVVVIEFNPTVPNDVMFVQAADFSVNHGCSLLALIELGRAKGYELAVCTLVNAFFVRKDKFPLLGIKDNSIDALYQPLHNGRIFQGYDGSIHVVGMDTLFWKDNAPLTEEDFQVLPKSLRVWNDALK